MKKANNSTVTRLRRIRARRAWVKRHAVTFKSVSLLILFSVPPMVFISSVFVSIWAVSTL